LLLGALLGRPTDAPSRFVRAALRCWAKPLQPALFRFLKPF
jgi:hypothetical protein